MIQVISELFLVHFDVFRYGNVELAWESLFTVENTIINNRESSRVNGRLDELSYTSSLLLLRIGVQVSRQEQAEPMKH